jgi:hypothetical protein
MIQALVEKQVKAMVTRPTVPKAVKDYIRRSVYEAETRAKEDKIVKSRDHISMEDIEQLKNDFRALNQNPEDAIILLDKARAIKRRREIEQEIVSRRGITMEQANLESELLDEVPNPNDHSSIVDLEMLELNKSLPNAPDSDFGVNSLPDEQMEKLRFKLPEDMMPVLDVVERENMEDNPQISSNNSQISNSDTKQENNKNNQDNQINVTNNKPKGLRKVGVTKV